jgi:hypothetical protein
MDYSKSGNPKAVKGQPKHKVGVKGMGAEKSPTGGRPTKEDIVAKLKAAASAKKAD